MRTVFRFASLYALIVFAFGFVIGAVRIFFVAPVTGPFWAVMAEAPIMIALSYAVCVPLVRRFWPIGGQTGVEIGIAAFLILQIMESLLAGFFGVDTYLNNILIYWGNILIFWRDLSADRLVGIAAQVLFAALPFIQILRVRAHERK